MPSGSPLFAFQSDTTPEMLVHLGFKSGKERLFRVCQNLHGLMYFSVSSTNTIIQLLDAHLGTNFPCTQRRYAQLPSYPLGFTAMVPSTSHRVFLTKNKGIRRSVRSPESLCVFPECLREKLSTVKVIPDLVFRKAIDNFPPTRVGPGNVCFDEPG